MFDYVFTGSGSNPSASDVVHWAATQRPPFLFSRDAAAALDQFASGGSLVKAPEVDFFAFSSDEGSEDCESSTFFFVKNGVASLADPPFPQADGDADCWVRGAFGTVDGAPVALQQEYDYAPGMSAEIQVATWEGSRFSPACGIDLTYKPKVTSQTFNNWGEVCAGPDCPRLRAAAFALVRSAQDPDASPDAVKGLSAIEQAEYQQAQSVVDKASFPDASDDAVLVPYVLDGRVYVVRIADFTIGWRDYADQSVKFLSVENGTIVPKAQFAVGIMKGDLSSVAIY